MSHDIDICDKCDVFHKSDIHEFATLWHKKVLKSHENAKKQKKMKIKQIGKGNRCDTFWHHVTHLDTSETPMCFNSLDPQMTKAQ
jgi:hypothetical protein